MDNKPPDHASLTHLDWLGGLDLLHASFSRQVFSRHSHDCYALGVIEKGALAFRYLHRDHEAARGDINLVVPGECHDGHAAGSGGWTYRMFYLSVDLVRDAARELDRDLPDFRTGVLQDKDLARDIRQTHLCLSIPQACVLEKESRLLLLLTSWIHRHAEGGKSPVNPENEPIAVRRCKEYLHAHQAETPQLTDLAKAAGLSPYHLLRVFARATGQTPHAYLTQLRVDRSKTLLSTSAPLADIACECGFADQSHLTRLFRRQFGLTPGAYRKILQNKPDPKD